MVRLVRYHIPKNVHYIYTENSDGKTIRIPIPHEQSWDRLTFCNIVERKMDDRAGRFVYKVRISTQDGRFLVGWMPHAGIDPIIYDPDSELMDGRFNL